MGDALDISNVRLETSDGHIIHVPCLREPVAFSILIDGTYEEATWEAIKGYLPRDGVFVDVGANVGLFSLQAAKYFGRYWQGHFY